MTDNKLEIDPDPLTTVFYPDDQISSYQHTVSSTTPMTGKVSHNSTGFVSFLDHNDEAEDRSIKIIPTANTWHPFNHKRHYSNVYRNKNGKNNIHDLHRKSIFDSTPSQKRIFYSDDHETDDQNFEYIDPVQNVNSIQDILNQNEPVENLGEEIATYISPSIPFSRPMKVEGIYRREKKKKTDHMSGMESGQHSSVYEENVHQKNDPFSKFKPSKPGDVNLLASNINTKYNPYTHHKPRPLTTPMTLNNYYEDYYGSRDPNLIYHQIIAANNKNRDATIRNGRYEKPSTTKSNKPFSLMLDVYPMPDETTFDSAIQATVATRTTPYNLYRRPYQSINSHAINHNFQYGKENSFYNHLKFPQIQQYRTQPFIAKDGFYRNYITNRMNTNVYRPLLKPSASVPISDSPTEDSPSQITVHLNLYPDRKKYHSRNVEIIHGDNKSSSLMTISSSASPSLSSSPSSLTPLLNAVKNDNSLWKRLERENASKPINEIDVRPSRHTYIPPFSAIKINALQHPFDVNDANSSQQQSDNSEKSAEYHDMVAFDSKKIHSNNKSVNMIYGPTPIPITSTSAPYFNEILPTVTTELSSLSSSTLPTQFESTMSSSIYTSPTIVANHFPFFNPNSISVETTAVMDTLNASKADQWTNNYDDTIRFPDQRK